MEAIPMCLGTIKYDSIRQTQLIYSLIIIRLATCFNEGLMMTPQGRNMLQI